MAEDGYGSTKLSSYYNDLECTWADSEKTYTPNGTDRLNYHGEFAVGYGDKVTCTFTNERKESSIDVTKTPDPTSVKEPGGTVTYSVKITNTSKVDDITLTKGGFVDFVSKAGAITGVNPGSEYSISDLVDCNGDAEVDPQADPPVTENGLPLTLKVGEMVTCTFTKDVNGNAGETEYDLVTVTGTNETGDEVKDDGPAEVPITDAAPKITIKKYVSSNGVDFNDVSASLPEPGGNFTYKVVVGNDSVSTDPVTITSLMDDVYGDLLDAGNGNISASTCADLKDAVIQPGNSLTCTFVAEFTGQPGSKKDIVTVKGHDDEGTATNEPSDDATAVITNVDPTIGVDKTVSPTGADGTFGDLATKPEPGGNFTFKVVVSNLSTSSQDTLEITSLVDDVYGDLTTSGHDGIVSTTCGAVEGTVLAPKGEEGDSVTCTFVGSFTGNFGASETDTVKAIGKDEEGNTTSAEDSAEVELTDVPSILQLDKSANPSSIQEPGGNVKFTIVITNPASFKIGQTTYVTVDSITLDTLTDTVFGNLTAECGIAGVVLAPGGQKTCVITRSVSGTPSSPHHNTATVTGYDDDNPDGCVEPVNGSCKEASDDATVTFTSKPPPPYNPKSDVTVTKAATPSVVLPLGGGSAPITYTIVAKNNGPDAAQNVKVSDSAPV